MFLEPILEHHILEHHFWFYNDTHMESCSTWYVSVLCFRSLLVFTKKNNRGTVVKNVQSNDDQYILQKMVNLTLGDNDVLCLSFFISWSSETVWSIERIITGGVKRLSEYHRGWVRLTWASVWDCIGICGLQGAHMQNHLEQMKEWQTLQTTWRDLFCDNDWDNME